MDRLSGNSDPGRQNREKAARRRNRRDFLKSFIITLAIIAPMFAAAVYIRQNEEVIPIDPEAAQTSEAVTEVPVKPAASYNLLGILSDERTGNLLCTALLRFDTARYQLVVCTVPETTILLDASAPAPLFTVFAQRGALGVKAAVEETLRVPVDGYVHLTTEQLSGVVDTLGEFEFTLDQELRVVGDNGLVVYTKPAGSSRFSGNDVAHLLANGNYIGMELLHLQERLWQAMLTAYADEHFPDSIAALYKSTVNSVQTDISSIEIFALTKAAGAVCAAPGVQVETVRLQGTFVDFRYELTEGSDERVWSYYGKK